MENATIQVAGLAVLSRVTHLPCRGLVLPAYPADVSKVYLPELRHLTCPHFWSDDNGVADGEGGEDGDGDGDDGEDGDGDGFNDDDEEEEEDDEICFPALRGLTCYRVLTISLMVWMTIIFSCMPWNTHHISGQKVYACTRWSL